MSAIKFLSINLIMGLGENWLSALILMTKWRIGQEFSVLEPWKMINWLMKCKLISDSLIT